MSEASPGVDPASYLQRLLDGGVLIATGVDGVYGRSAAFEEVVERLDALITRAGRNDGAEVLRFPPAITQRDFEMSGYLHSFPHLAGTVHSFCGDERAHREILRCVGEGEDWTAGQKIAGLVLTPAACYPVYPVMAKRGGLPGQGRLVDVYSYCFRREPSLDPTRLQLFRMREYVRLGTPEQCLEFRETWLERGQALIASLGLPLEIDVANDPFFGRAGEIMAENQRRQKLKFELLIPVADPARPTACLSFNYHSDHFGQVWNIRTPDGALGHTACVGFGMERITLALFKHHGLDPAAWPEAVRAALWSRDRTPAA